MAFWADTAPFKGSLDSPRALFPELQGNKDSVRWCCATHGGPRTPSRTPGANLDCGAFFENTLLHTDQWKWKANRIELSKWPWPDLRNTICTIVEKNCSQKYLVNTKWLVELRSRLRWSASRRCFSEARWRRGGLGLGCGWGFLYQVCKKDHINWDDPLSLNQSCSMHW